MGILTEIRNVRPAAVAGVFYPADPAKLAGLVDRYITDANATERAAKAIIAPHAGYVYSGPIAGSAYRAFDTLDEAQVQRVIVIGPSHRVAFRGVATPGHSHFRTPLGDVHVDTAAIRAIESIDGVEEYPAAHAMEHGLEVHLPFLQRQLGEFELVPLVAGVDAEESIERILKILWGGPETRVVVSSDLSHYHDYSTARGLDRATSDAILALDDERIASDGACGAVAVRALLRVARSRSMRVELLDLRNSGDTAGDKSRVVGYGAYAFYEDGDDRTA